MSTGYRPLPDILYAQLFDGCLQKHGVCEVIRADSTESQRYLEGNDGVLVAYRKKDGTCTFSRLSFTPTPWSVFDAITAEFGVELVTEHDHRYWGFVTEEEWDSFNDRLAREYEDRFYNDVLHYVRDEPNGLKPNTVGMINAEIAKTLIESDPRLTAPENRAELLNLVRTIHDLDRVTRTKGQRSLN
jgi:hypothetical protein